MIKKVKKNMILQADKPGGNSLIIKIMKVRKFKKGLREFEKHIDAMILRRPEDSSYWKVGQIYENKAIYLNTVKEVPKILAALLCTTGV